MAITYVGAEITKSWRDENGHLMVSGKATGPDLDHDQQRMDPNWLKTAMPKWFEIGNIRADHQPGGVGKATELVQKGDSWDITAKIVDPVAALKVEEDVFTGFSVGIKGAQIMKSADAPGGLVTGGRIVEVSLTDRPCNPTCTLQLAKSAVPGMKVKADEFDRDLMLVKTETVIETPEVEEPVEVEVTQEDVDKFESADADIDNIAIPDKVEKRDVSTKEREKLADKGQALPDGSFPIANVGDLKNAIRAIGRAKDPAKAKAHIKKRAKALGQTQLIPDTWKADDADLTKHDSSDLAAIRQGLIDCLVAELEELSNGEDEMYDINQLCDTLGMFLCWWNSEAFEGEVESPNMEKISDGITHVTLSDTTDKAETADVTKALEAKLDELKKTFDEKLKASEEIQKGLEAELTKMKSLPKPGGPVMTKGSVDAAKTRLKDDTLNKAEYYEQLAATVTDRELAQGYRAYAIDLRKAAN